MGYVWVEVAKSLREMAPLPPIRRQFVVVNKF
jgi:hypothetical protein